MVKAAYSSGKPAHGVGAGNALIIVDETADLKDAADKIMRSKTFDHATKKLSVTMTLYKYKEFPEAIELVNRITAHSGPGHSCGIHTVNGLRIRELSHKVKVSRIMIRQPQCLANSGAWTNGMPMSMTLGCGTWGGNSTSSNVTWEHLLNYTWVSYPIPSTQPSDVELFGSIMYED